VFRDQEFQVRRVFPQEIQMSTIPCGLPNHHCYLMQSPNNQSSQNEPTLNSHAQKRASNSPVAHKHSTQVLFIKQATKTPQIATFQGIPATAAPESQALPVCTQPPTMLSQQNSDSGNKERKST
jgi:hypothetical protein